MKKTLEIFLAVGWFACMLTLTLPALLAVATCRVVKWATLPIRYTTAWVTREFVLSTMAAADLRREDMDDECQGLLKEVDGLLDSKKWR